MVQSRTAGLYRTGLLPVDGQWFNFCRRLPNWVFGGSAFSLIVLVLQPCRRVIVEPHGAIITMHRQAETPWSVSQQEAL